MSKVIRNIHRSYYLSGASGAFGEKIFFKITFESWLSLDIMNWFSSFIMTSIIDPRPVNQHSNQLFSRRKNKVFVTRVQFHRHSQEQKQKMLQELDKFSMFKLS